MLTLINMVKTDDNIEADYIPEDGNVKAHVKLNVLSDEYDAEEIQDYGSMYVRMALNGLRRISDELQSGKIAELPSKRVVMWY